MPWVPETGSAKTWSSRTTMSATTYVPETTQTNASWPLPVAPDPCRETLAELSPVVQSDGRIDFAYLIKVPTDWCVSPTTFVVIGSGLTSP